MPSVFGGINTLFICKMGNAMSTETDIYGMNAEADAARLDWLAMQYIVVRRPLLYGSLKCFSGCADSDDPCDALQPFNIRAAIDAAMKGDGG